MSSDTNQLHAAAEAAQLAQNWLNARFGPYGQGGNVDDPNFMDWSEFLAINGGWIGQLNYQQTIAVMQACLVHLAHNFE